MTRGTLGEIQGDQGENKYQLAPRIDGADVQLLWHSDFWDGPLSGMVRFQEEFFSANEVLG
jgi:hypothetical protein